MIKRIAIPALLLLALSMPLPACGGGQPMQTSAETDREALTRLYETAGGPNWLRNTNWLSEEPLGHWDGVTTDADGRVVGLDLYRNNLDGFIPREVGNLDRLEALDIANRRETESALGSLLGTISDIGSEETNTVYGCVPGRLKGRLDMKRSLLGDSQFCDKAGEAEVNRLTLEHAIRGGDTADVRRVVGDVALVDDVSPEGDAFVGLAIGQGNPEMVQVLLDAGINPACSNESGRTLLHRAVVEGNAAVVRMLAEACSDALNTVRKEHIYDETLLSMAIDRGDVDTARALIEAGADPNVRISSVLTQGAVNHFSYAVESGEVGIVRILIEAGADVNAADAGRTPLERALATWDGDMMQVLVEAGADAEGTSPARALGPESLDRAIVSGDADMVAGIVEAGADVNATDERGRSPLYTAIVSGNTDVVRALLEAGADVNATDDSGDPVLYRAIISGNADVVRLLLEAGADLNARDERGNSPLHSAIVHGNADMVRTLAESGADVNATDDSGYPMLFHAIVPGDADVVRALVEVGADVNVMDGHGNSMLGLARFYERTEIAGILVDAGALE